MTLCFRGYNIFLVWIAGQWRKIYKPLDSNKCLCRRIFRRYNHQKSFLLMEEAWKSMTCMLLELCCSAVKSEKLVNHTSMQVESLISWVQSWVYVNTEILFCIYSYPVYQLLWGRFCPCIHPKRFRLQLNRYMEMNYLHFWSNNCVGW